MDGTAAPHDIAVVFCARLSCRTYRREFLRSGCLSHDDGYINPSIHPH